MNDVADEQGQEEQQPPSISNQNKDEVSRFNRSYLPPALQQLVDLHRLNVNSGSSSHSYYSNPPPLPDPRYFPPPLPSRSYLPPLPFMPPPFMHNPLPRSSFLNPGSSAFDKFSQMSQVRGIDGGGGSFLNPDIRSFPTEHLFPKDVQSLHVIGIPTPQRLKNEQIWKKLHENKYFALVGATAMTHCYSEYSQISIEDELHKTFQQDVDELFRRFEPPDFLLKEQKARIQTVLHQLEAMWNASFPHVNKLHDACSRFLAFNINLSTHACPLPTMLQHKFRTLAHSTLRILTVPMRPQQDARHQRGQAYRKSSRLAITPLTSPRSDLDFWREVSRRYTGHRTVLKGWLLMNFAHPYPNENDKLIMAQITGMSRVQIGNWFINQRVRWWRPLVEELASEILHEDQNQQFSPANPPSMPPSLSAGLDMTGAMGGLPAPPPHPLPPLPLPPPPPHILEQLRKHFPPEVLSMSSSSVGLGTLPMPPFLSNVHDIHNSYNANNALNAHNVSSSQHGLKIPDIVSSQQMQAAQSSKEQIYGNNVFNLLNKAALQPNLPFNVVSSKATQHQLENLNNCDSQQEMQTQGPSDEHTKCMHIDNTHDIHNTRSRDVMDVNGMPNMQSTQYDDNALAQRMNQSGEINDDLQMQICQEERHDLVNSESHNEQCVLKSMETDKFCGPDQDNGDHRSPSFQQEGDEAQHSFQQDDDLSQFSELPATQIAKSQSIELNGQNSDILRQSHEQIIQDQNGSLFNFESPMFGTPSSIGDIVKDCIVQDQQQQLQQEQQKVQAEQNQNQEQEIFENQVWNPLNIVQVKVHVAPDFSQTQQDSQMSNK